MAAEFKINRLRFTWAGPWTASTFYNRDAVVSYNGKTYVCLVPNTSSNSFNADLNYITGGGASTPYWQLVVDGRVWKQAWAPSTYYFTGNIVTYGGTVYNCITQHTSVSSFDATKWTTISQSSAWRTNWTTNTSYGIGDVVKYGGIVYQCNTLHTSASTTVLGLENLGIDLSKWTIINKGLDYKGTWVSNTRYKAQDIVKVGPDLYLSTVGHSAMTFNSSSEWTLWVPGIEFVGTWNSATAYQVGDTASYGGYTYVSATQNNTNNIPSVDAVDWVLLTQGYTIGGEWTTGLPAKIGTLVTRGGRLYVAIADSLSEDPTAITLTTTYTASGSSGTTVKVANSASLRPGMNIIGVGFTLGQTVSRVVDSTTIILDKGPDGTAIDAQSLTFVGVNYTYWQMVVPGSNWNNRWTAGTAYTLGNLVVWKNGTYRCIQKHTSSAVSNRPDLDIMTSYWVLVIAHHRKNASTTTGDVEIYNGTTGAYDVLPIGTNSYTLRSTSGNPTWSHLNAINAVYYVAPTGTDSTSSGWGQTWDKPWKSIKFACDYIEAGIYYPIAKSALTNAKEWLAQEVYNFCLYNKNNNIAPFTSSSVFDATKTVRDTRLVVDAVIYDISRGGNSQTVAATLAYFASGKTDTFFSTGITSEIAYFISALTYLRTLVISNAYTGNAPALNYQVLNGQSSVTSQPALGGGSVEAQAVVDTTTLLTILINALTNVSTAGVPAANSGATATVMVKTGTYSEILPIVVPANTAINGDELRGAVVQPVTIYNGIIKATTIVDTVGLGISSQTLSTITALSTANLVVGEPIQFGTTTGNITAFTTYYIHGVWSSTKFSIKTSSTATTSLTLSNDTVNLSIVAYGGQALYDMFRCRNGSGLRNMTLTGLLGFLGNTNVNGTARPTGGSFACLDPGTGVNDTKAWIIRRSPYVQNVTTFGYGCTGMKIDGSLHSGGNKSMVANDFTQIISKGIGVWCTGSGSLTEIVSVFAYYGYCGYFAEDGGRMRATNGNTSYGSYGVIAEGYDISETPISGKVFNQSSQVQANVQSSFGSNAQLLKVLYGNAGSNYNQTTTNMLSYSNAFTNTSWTSAGDGNVTLTKNTSAPIGTAVDGWSLTGNTANTGENYIAQNVTIAPAGAYYSNVGAVNISGSGSAATFNVTVTSTAYLVTVNTGGSGYVGGGAGAGNQLYIAGSQLGGIDSVNDCIITVDTLSSSSILTVLVSGTVPSGSALSYTASLYIKKGTAISIDMQAIFSGSSTKTSQLSYTFDTNTVTASNALGGFLPTQYGAQATAVTGWYRLWFAFNDTSGLNNSLQIRIYPKGYSGIVGAYSYIYGAQLELSSATYTPSFYLENSSTDKFTSYANYTVVGAGSGAVLVGDELRGKSVFETRVVADSSGGVGGNGYLTASNNAQSGTTTYVQLAQSDVNLASNYVGMRVFINSGTGAGQYGYISSYDSSTKIAYVLKETFDAIGITNSSSSGNLLTLGGSYNTARLYVGQPIQFIPTYYTATITGTSLAQTSILTITGGVINTILVSSTVGMYVNMPFSVSASTSTLLAGYTYYVYSINPADPVTGLYPTNTIQVTNQLFGNLWQLNTVGTVASIYMNFTSNTGYLTSNTTNMSVNLPIQFTGQAQGGLTAGTTYYIQDIIDATNFTISANLVNVTVTSTTSPSTLTVTTGTASNLTPLNPIVFSAGSGAIFGGVTEGQKYYISKILTGSTFAIATSVITATITATSSGTNLIVTSDTSQFVVNNPIIFTGTTFGNIIAETIYYIQVINSGTTFTISQTPGGGALGLLDKSGVITARTCPASFTGITTVASGTMTGSSTATKKVVTVSATSSMNATWSTTVFGNVAIGSTYYVNTIDSVNNQITITTVQNSGSAFTLQTKAGSMNLAAVGWDHVSPGTAPVASLDSSSSYYIEPRTTYSEPTFTQIAAGTVIALASPTVYTQIAYGNGYWIAVPNGNAVGARSVDGNTWTQVVMPVALNYSGIAYGNGYFVTINTNGTTAAYSKSNGIGWRTTTLPTNTTWSSITYGNGKFVALGSTDTTAAYSIDSGVTWSPTLLKASNIFTANGNAQLSTAQKQFGTASLYLDGTANTYISSPANADFGTTSSQDFAIECFVKFSAISGSQPIFDTRTNGTEVALTLDISGAGLLRLFVNGAYVITGNTSLTTAWTHVAVTRSNGTTSLFVGGVLQSATYSDTNVYLARPIRIGSYYNGSPMTGYIDEFRISKNASRYQTTFTPPGGQFYTDTNTVTLIHFDGANASTDIRSVSIKGNMSCIAYGNGRFVALATGSNIAQYSTDGITWNSSTLPATSTWVSIAYGNGLFVAVSNANSPSVGSLYSTDGITWNISNLKIQADKVSYGQGIFLAIRSGGVAYIGDGAGDWKTKTVTNYTYTALAFGYRADSIGIFVGLSSTYAGVRVFAGAKTQGRAIITSNVITSLSEWEPGSGYVSAATGTDNPPSVTFTDPNVTTLATVTPRISSGTLGNPSFYSRGTGYSSNSTVITITGNGYSDAYQKGLSIILYNLTRLPQPGDNLTISGVSQIFKVTSATVMYGTSAPNIEANVQVSPEITTAQSPAQDVVVSIRTKYSQVRLTGHDYLNIGFGTQAESNYPNLPTETGLQPQNQQVEVNYGRVFFTSTDQDGNFNVGGLFGVQQATGIVTLSASQFGLTGLNTLSLGGIAVGGAGVIITQFSTDGTFTANSDSIISTQRAIKTYLTARLSQGGSNTFTGQLIAGTVLVGGPNLIASSIPNGTTGSNVKMISMVNFCGTPTNPRTDSLVDGNMVAQNFFYKHFFHR